MLDFLKIPKARAVLDDGTVEDVVLPTSLARAEAVAYDPDRHKGKLHCPSCDVKLHFNRGSAVMCGGTMQGQRPHFKTNPGHAHDPACVYIVEPHDDHDSDVDRTRGFRIHLNLSALSNLFNERAHHYQRAEGRKLVTHDPRLAGRESLAVQTASDLVTRLLKNGDPARIRDSVVVQGKYVLPWHQFFIRHAPDGKPHVRYHGLVERLQRMNKGARLPVLMEIIADQGAQWHQRGDSGVIDSRKFFWRRSEAGAEFIAPRLYLDPPAHGKLAVETARALQDMTKEQGVYLVLGFARLHTYQTRNGLLHALNISVADESQVARVNIRDIRKKPDPSVLTPG
ncbi:hypothetical protein [Micavibrio aeruginosavorus]|uniref:hypothetical protein n=1 Tax=Micavibrio aeruginosavorus TaxID=349221 RepID=UPI003F4AE44F